MRTLVIINKVAAKARRVWPAIEEALTRESIEYDLYETTSPGDATVRTRAALKNGTTTVAVVGGDGTLSEAAEGFFELDPGTENLPVPLSPGATLAILPAGTGDDFARGLSGKRASFQTWIDALIAYTRTGATNTVPVDVLYGICNGFQKPFICLNASTMGIGGETARRVAGQGRLMRRFSGEFRFVAAALGALAVWRERRVRVSLDDRVLVDASMNLAAVANALYAGGGMMLSPEARIDDGQLDVVTATRISRVGIIRELSRIHSGGHVANPKVMIAQGRVVRIETFAPEDAMPIEADGNVRGLTPVEFRILPGALRFVIPVHE
jgi:diacylglycerol kinase (ATP)